MGKWMDALKNMPSGGFVSFGSSTETHFHKIADAEIRREGIKRLKVAAHGLPLDFPELQAFFDGDIHDFGSGGVSPAGIRKACEWFAHVYPAWRAAQ